MVGVCVKAGKQLEVGRRPVPVCGVAEVPLRGQSGHGMPLGWRTRDRRTWSHASFKLGGTGRERAECGRGEERDGRGRPEGRANLKKGLGR